MREYGKKEKKREGEKRRRARKRRRKKGGEIKGGMWEGEDFLIARAEKQQSTNRAV